MGLRGEINLSIFNQLLNMIKMGLKLCFPLCVVRCAMRSASGLCMCLVGLGYASSQETYASSV